MAPAEPATSLQTGGIVRPEIRRDRRHHTRRNLRPVERNPRHAPADHRHNGRTTFQLPGGIPHADVVTFSLTNNGGTAAPGSDLSLQVIAVASMPDINNNVETIRSYLGRNTCDGQPHVAYGTPEIDVDSPTLTDLLQIDGTLTLGGNLNVMLDDGYQPAAGTRVIGTCSQYSAAISHPSRLDSPRR